MESVFENENINRRSAVVLSDIYVEKIVNNMDIKIKQASVFFQPLF